VSGVYRFTTSMGSTFVAACAGIQLAINATREQAIHLELRREPSKGLAGKRAPLPARACVSVIFTG
jgi:hypothetical protein